MSKIEVDSVEYEEMIEKQDRTERALALARGTIVVIILTIVALVIYAWLAGLIK